METHKLSDNGPRLDTIKLDAYRCYICGQLFDEGKHKKTLHHAIPKFLKPKRNVLLPVGESCHQEINTYTVQSVPKAPRNPNFNVVLTNVQISLKGAEKSVDRLKRLETELIKLKEKTTHVENATKNA